MTEDFRKFEKEIMDDPALPFSQKKILIEEKKKTMELNQRYERMSPEEKREYLKQGDKLLSQHTVAQEEQKARGEEENNEMRDRTAFRLKQMSPDLAS